MTDDTTVARERTIRTAEELQEARELLDQAIAASEMSLRSFAENLMVRDERTVRRWRHGKSPIPPIVAAACRRIIREAAQHEKRR